MDIVHPPEFIELAKPRKREVRLNDGRIVIVTTFDLCYSLALLFSDETLYRPQNFIFPNKSDPFEEPDYENIDLGDINTGLFFKQTVKILNQCKEKDLFLFPVLEFIDATMVKRNSVEPVTLVPGIFNSMTRNLSRSWIVLGYIEPLANVVGDKQAYELEDAECVSKSSLQQVLKLNTYHEMLKHIHSDLVDLQKTGFWLDVPIIPPDDTNEQYGDWKTVTVLAVPVLQAVLSDTKGANGFTGRVNNHGKNVKGLCRDCDIMTSDADPTFPNSIFDFKRSASTQKPSFPRRL